MISVRSWPVTVNLLDLLCSNTHVHFHCHLQSDQPWLAPVWPRQIYYVVRDQNRSCAVKSAALNFRTNSPSTMSERSYSKRRHSTPPSPPKSDAATQGGRPTFRQPPKNKGRGESPRKDSRGEGSRENSFPEPSMQGRSAPAQPGQGQSLPNPSIQSISVQGLGLMVPQGTQSRAADEECLAGPSQQNASNQGMSLLDFGSMMPQNHLSGAPEEESAAMSGPEFSSFMNEFMVDAMSLSPFHFPPPGAFQGSPQHASQLPNGSPRQLFTLSTQQNAPDMPATMSIAPVYANQSAPQIEVVGQQTQAEQFQPSSFSLALQQAHARTANFIPTGHPQPLDQSVQQGLASQNSTLPVQSRSFLQQTVSSAQGAVPSHQPENFETQAYDGAGSLQSMLNPSAGRHAQACVRQQTQSAGRSTLPRSSYHQAPIFPPYSGPGGMHSWTAPTISQQPMLPHQNLVPQLGLVLQQSPASLQSTPQQQGQSPAIQHHNPSQPPLPTQATSQLNPYPITPIEPRIVHEQYLWTQLEIAQVTMVGTLTDLVVRTRNGQLGLDINDRQVRNVTSNLINIMSLWYLLRRDRGWPL